MQYTFCMLIFAVGNKYMLKLNHDFLQLILQPLSKLCILFFNVLNYYPHFVYFYWKCKNNNEQKMNQHQRF